MDKETEARLTHWLDRSEIHDRVCQYARAIDRHDDPLLADVFHPDAIDNHGEWVGRRDDFVRWANHEVHEKYIGHSHNITTHNCEIDGDTAHAETYVIFVLRHADEKTATIGGGRYVDRLEKREGTWRIVLRRVVADWRITADASSFATRMGEQGTWDRSDISYERPLALPENLSRRLAEG